MSYISDNDSVKKKPKNKNAMQLKTFQSPEKQLMLRSQIATDKIGKFVTYSILECGKTPR